MHAHGLRHTYAAELARERTPINVIRDALGHTTLSVTGRYLRDVGPLHVIETMRVRRCDVGLDRVCDRRHRCSAQEGRYGSRASGGH